MDRGKLAGILISTISTTLFLVLGSCWMVDRTRRWETPRLDPGRFSVVRDERGAGGTAGWLMVPVNLRCPHCLASLQALQRSQRGDTRPGLIVLVVDQESEPTPTSVDALRAETVWWDRHGLWRGRWGHRIYGEVLRFDPHGRYLETWPPLSSGSSVALENQPLPERKEAP